MILPRIKLPITLIQLEIFLEALANDHNLETLRQPIKISGRDLKGVGIEFRFIQDQTPSVSPEYIDIGTLQAILIKEDVISIRSSINWLDNSFPGRDFYHNMYLEIYNNWHIAIPESLDESDRYNGAVDAIQRRIGRRYDASNIPGYYRSGSDAEEIIKNLAYKDDTVEAKKISEETLEKINNRKDRLIASRNDDEIERYEQIISEFECKLPELANFDENDYDIEGFTVSQPKIYTSHQNHIESDSEEIYLPQKEKTIGKWKRFYQIIQETREVYKQRFSDWDNEDPEPSIDELRDAIATKMDEKPSERNVYHIIKAGDAGLLR